MYDFLFWLFFVGLIIASMQDLKRREVDNWLNLLLLVSGISFIFYRAIFENNPSLIFQLGFALVFMFILTNLLYGARIFAGGDAKLLVAMTAFFVTGNFLLTLIGIGIFVFFFMFAGSVYGLIFSFVLYVKNYKKVNKELKNSFDNFWVKFAIVLGLALLLFGLFERVFILPSVLLLMYPFLYVFAKSLENVSMIKEIPWSKLREGDWLAEDVKVGKKIIKSKYEGLSLKEISLLRKKKKVKIKEGLPFVPAFLMAFLVYVFLKDWFLGLFIGL